MEKISHGLVASPVIRRCNDAVTSDFSQEWILRNAQLLCAVLFEFICLYKTIASKELDPSPLLVERKSGRNMRRKNV
jgi:hypothetical protein